MIVEPFHAAGGNRVRLFVVPVKPGLKPCPGAGPSSRRWCFSSPPASGWTIPGGASSSRPRRVCGVRARTARQVRGKIGELDSGCDTLRLSS
jgi:hypothetical protein